jgi:hypothetical protein
MSQHVWIDWRVAELEAQNRRDHPDFAGRRLNAGSRQSRDALPPDLAASKNTDHCEPFIIDGIYISSANPISETRQNNVSIARTDSPVALATLEQNSCTSA